MRYLITLFTLLLIAQSAYSQTPATFTRLEAQLASASTPADTYRWDTVFALRVADVNKAIVAANSSPTTFDYTSTDDGAHLQGTFDHWQITSGGDGKQVNFVLPISGGNLNLKGNDYPLAGLVVDVALWLAYFEDTTHRNTPGGGTFHDLKINPQPDPVAQKSAVVTKVENAGFMLATLLKILFEDWLNAHLDQFEHVFATVNLNRLADRDQFAWLLPTATDYAFISKDNPDDSLLGVLCNTQNRPVDGLDDQVSANAVPDGARAGFLISNERYLTQLIQPALPLVFPGLKTTDVQLSTDQNSLQLINPDGIPVSFTCQVPDDSGGTTTQTYSGKIDELEITLEDVCVTVRSRTQVDVGLGVVAFCQSVNRYQVATQLLPNGKMTLNYTPLPALPPDHWVEHTEPLLEILVAIVAIVVAAIVTAATDGAGGVVGLLVIGLLTGLVAASPELLGMLGHDEAPDIDLLEFNATDPIVWAGQDRFQLSSAQINGCLQLGGTFVPAPAIPAIVHQNAPFWP